jgi:hypothetical protein
MVVQDFAADLDAISHRAKDIDNRAADSTFAATGLADDSECFALMEIEADAINCADFSNLASEDAAHDGEANGEILHLEKLSVSL